MWGAERLRVLLRRGPAADEPHGLLEPGPTRKRGSMGESRRPAAPAEPVQWRDVLTRARLVRVGYLLLAVTVVAGGATGWRWMRHAPLFQLREVMVPADNLKHVDRELLGSRANALRGNFFAIDLARARHELEQIPWVRAVTLRRVWPDRLLVTVEEHQVLARWAAGGLVNTFGEPFDADYKDDLPLLSGPPGTERELTQRYQEFGGVLALTGRTLKGVQRSERNAWTLRLDDGLTLELGRDLVADRLRRFVTTYDETLGRIDAGNATVDMRYSNGFSLRLAEGRMAHGGRDRAPRN